MGSTLNELSDFGNSELVKCGEIVVETKQNKYFFSCARCNGVFSQLVIFVRHLQWEHQGRDGLPFNQEMSQDACVYTMEELLNYKGDKTVAVENLLTEESAIGELNSDEDDDTGVDSDMELEKEIQELLYSVAAFDSSSEHRTEYSEYDSGVETKNMTNQSDREDCKQTEKNWETQHEIKLVQTHNNLDNNSVESGIGERYAGTENESGIDSNNASKLSQSCSNLEEQTPPKEGEISACGSTEDKIHKTCFKPGIKQTTKSTSDNRQEVDQEYTLENNIEMEVVHADKGRQFEYDSIKSNENWKIITLPANTKPEAAKVSLELLHLNFEEVHEESDIVSSSDEIESGRYQSEEIPLTGIELESSMVMNDQPNASAKMDELIEIKFTKDEIVQRKTSLPQLCLYELKGKESELQKPASHCLSGSQREYKDSNESSLEIAALSDSAVAQSVAREEPLDLSFDASTQLHDAHMCANSDKLKSTTYSKTTTMTEQADNLLEHQATSADNPILSTESNQLYSSNSIENYQLPPFSKMFKNTANTWKVSNGFLAQSTPKQKHIKSGSPLRSSAKVNMKTYDTLESTQINFESCIQRKCNILNRVADPDEKENKPKKIKTETANSNANTKVTTSGSTKGIEILSVDIIFPDGRTSKTESTLSNSNALKPKTDDISNFKLPIEKMEATVSGHCRTKKSESKCDVAADSTSENHTTSINEIDYTPEDTLNQLKFEAIANSSLMPNSFNITATLNDNINQTSFLEEQSLLDDSIPSIKSEEDKENYILLRSVGLKIIMDANAEDSLKLEHLEAMREKASAFANIYADFKYLWKVGKGIKSYEELELDFSKLTQRLNEHYKIELTITETKRIVNLVSMWFMESYHKWFIEKKPALSSVDHYLNLFRYLPKTSRRIFYCEECPRYFLTQQKYSTHFISHMAMAPSCAYCQNIFTSRNAQLLHAKVCTNFKCIECGFKFENAASLEYHIRQKHLHQCEKCGQLCANEVDLERHEHQNPIRCGLCNRFFDSGAEIQKHRQDTFHWDYTCRECEIFLPTATQMKQHVSLCSGSLGL